MPPGGDSDGGKMEVVAKAQPNAVGMSIEEINSEKPRAPEAGVQMDGGGGAGSGVPTEYSANNVSTSADSSNDISVSNTSAGEDAAPAPPKAEIVATEPEASRTKLQTAIIMTSLCSSIFLAALDVTIITTALPTISEHFQSSAGYTWIGSAYMLATAASTPSWGKFSDIWGRKPILLLAIGIFFVGSLLCAVSVNVGMLIASRGIQGVGGGGLLILVNIAISDLFSMRNRGKYFGMIGGVWAFASTVGPVLGGVFTEKVSWRWCFYINLPITGAVFIALCIFLHLDNPKTPVWDGLKAVDWLGSLAIIGGTLMLLLGLEFGGVTYPWSSAKVLCLIIFGIFVACLFIINEWKFARYPLMPLRLFTKRTNIAALGVCFCHGYAFIGASYYLPLYFQAVIGATPLLSGVYLLPLALSLSFVSAGTGVFIKRTGQYVPPIWFGMGMMTAGFALFINLGAKANWAKLIIYQIIAGIGVGPNFQSPLIALQNFVAPRDIAVATSTFGFVRNLSTSISVVIGSVVFQNEMQKKLPTLTESLGPKIAGALSGGSAGASIGLVRSLPPVQRDIARAAFADSLKIMWTMYMAFTVMGLLISLFISHQNLSKEHHVTKTGLVEEEAKRKELQLKKRASKERLRQEKLASKEAQNGGVKIGSGEAVPKQEV
ncbi:MFS general substrate transporter [Venustampulla echinocandica]|uniref:Efflux pump dotC n=1 Tax=Venustampulla echinocandica TaxID=2656787 RepID=A0A370TF08_9HELO|nr:MFS general substrate transporter [Venustampulla echinocandica]RDL33276.1 MFS general substrate transporter [Venustampulla echinocandica]